MLTKEELRTIKQQLLNVMPTQGRPIRALMPELQAWQKSVAAVDRELREATPTDAGQAQE